MFIQKHVTLLGPIWSHWTDIGLYRIALQQPDLPTPNATELAKQSLRMVEKFDAQLVEFCRTGKKTFDDVTVDPTGWTDFSRLVYKGCREIPPGKTLTYKQLAKKAGNEKASRAVGAAMARNRILLVIPCHRVIASNGQLRGFSAPGGLATKQSLLDLERQGDHATAGELFATN